MVLLKVLGALVVLVIGIAGMATGCYCFMQSGENISDGEALFYCGGWMIGLFGGLTIIISSFFLMGQAFL